MAMKLKFVTTVSVTIRASSPVEPAMPAHGRGGGRGGVLHSHITRLPGNKTKTSHLREALPPPRAATLLCYVISMYPNT